MAKKLLSILLCCVFLAGCSKQTDTPSVGASPAAVPPEVFQTAVPPEEVSSRLIVDREQFFEAPKREIMDDYILCVGIQFYQGEPVVLNAKLYSSPGLELVDGKYQPAERSVYPDSGLYMQRTDGSNELLIPGSQLMENVLSEEDRDEQADIAVTGTWYVDGDRNCYYTPQINSRYLEFNWDIDHPGREREKGYFLKLDHSGKLLYKTILEPGFEAEGFGCIGETMYVFLGGEIDGAAVKRVVAFDPETGVLSGTDAFVLRDAQIAKGVNCFGWGADGLYLYDRGGIRRVDLSDGSVSDFISFAGSTWSSLGRYWKLRDFRVLDGGDVEALYSCDEGDGWITPSIAKGTLEVLSMVKGERKTVTLRAASIPEWMKHQAAQFNKTNTEYLVVLEELAASKAEDLADYAKQTYLEMSAGKGPDILCSDLMGDYVRGLLDKGMFLELSGSMEAKGIREGDYLPSAFGNWRAGDKIYGINPALYPRGYKIRKDALPAGTGELDIHKLMDALSARQEGATYYACWEEEAILGLFLEGSEDLWGMVDWEQGTCDFSGGLFAQILDAAKRYGYDEKHRYQTLVRGMNYDNIYRYDSRAELEAEGMMVSGVLFDDGCHGAVDGGNTLAVNAASQQKEGAMEFLKYLLGEKVQSELTQGIPVNRAALEKQIKAQREELAGGKEYSFGDSYIDEGEIVKFSKTFTEADVTDERVAEYLEALENVRFLPSRTGPILDIVYTEAADYFNGSKSIQEVAAVISNRVQLYLDEGNKK